MKLYTCCPDSNCSAYKDSFNFLKSWGIEPSIQVDDHHFFEFELPDYWQLSKKINFNFELAHKVRGMLFCLCDNALEEQEKLAVKVTCKDCGLTYLFCPSCEAIDKWKGCSCA